MKCKAGLIKQPHKIYRPTNLTSRKQISIFIALLQHAVFALSFEGFLFVLQECKRCCINDKCNDYELRGTSDSAKIIASLSMLIIMAFAAMIS